MIVALIKRNLKLYYRDKAAVFFSMLGAMLIILLYIMFLGNMIKGVAEEFAGDHARFFMDSWIMAGVIAAASMTTCLAGFGIMVDDRAKKIVRDFESSPIPRSRLVLSYVLSSVIIGLSMSFFTFVLAQGYILLYGGQFLSIFGLVQMIGWIILSVSASSAFVFFLVALIKSQNAFGTLSSLIGTLIGFITGVYVPIGNLPDAIQWIIKFFPVSHSAAAMRQIMMNEAVNLAYVPAEIKTFMGITFQYGDATMMLSGHAIVLVTTFIVFYGLSVLVMSKHKEKQ
jgi:multidrug/hemolysin transport system permease protein